MKKAFTLIELMIVIALIGVIAAIAMPNFNRLSITNNTAKAKSDIRSLQMAVESYYLYNKSLYPSTLDDLKKTVPTIVRSIPTDPFLSSKAQYGYIRSPNAKYYAIYSVGPKKDGSVAVDDEGVLKESDGVSCIYVSNIQEDSQP